jgi:hypothetical protein
LAASSDGVAASGNIMAAGWESVAAGSASAATGGNGLATDGFRLAAAGFVVVAWSADMASAGTETAGDKLFPAANRRCYAKSCDRILKG